MLSSLWQVIVVPSVAKINTFWVAAEPSKFQLLSKDPTLRQQWIARILFDPAVNKPRMSSS